VPQHGPTTLPERQKKIRALTGMGLVGLLCLLLVVGAATVGPWRVNPVWEVNLPEPENTPTPTATATPTVGTPPAPEMPEGGPESTWDLSWLGWLLTAVAAVALVLLALRLVNYARRPRQSDPGSSQVLTGTAEPDLPTLREGVSHAERHLRAAGPPRDAIIAAWVAIEEAAERSGAPRRPAQTPTEHTTTVLRRTGADPDAAHRLLGLYHRARFSDAEPTDADLTAAAEALADLAASWPELARGGPARPDPAGSQGRYPTDTPGEHPWSGSSGSPSPADAPGSSGSPSPADAPGSSGSPSPADAPGSSGSPTSPPGSSP